MGFLRERQRGNNIILSFGPYATPRRAYTVKNVISLLMIGVVLVAGFFLWEVWMNPESYKPYRFFNRVPFIKYEWTAWMVENPLQVAIGALGIVFILSRFAAISGRIAYLLLGKYRKVIFTPEKVKLPLLFFTRSCPRKNVMFEMVVHPRADDVDVGAYAKGGKPPKNFYEKTGVVIMRCGGTKVIKIATIYDWKDFKLGHKAEKLAVTLQTLLNKTVEKPKKDKPPENKEFFGEKVDLE